MTHADEMAAALRAGQVVAEASVRDGRLVASAIVEGPPCRIASDLFGRCSEARAFELARSQWQPGMIITLLYLGRLPDGQRSTSDTGARWAIVRTEDGRSALMSAGRIVDSRIERWDVVDATQVARAIEYRWV